MKYEIAEDVSGSFVGNGGRVTYDFKAGVHEASDLDPEVLALLVENGSAVKVRKTTPENGEK